MKSMLRLSETKLPVRCTQAFVDLCRAQSKVYPRNSTEGGAKLSAARFLKESAKEKLLKCGIKPEYIKSIC